MTLTERTGEELKLSMFMLWVRSEDCTVDSGWVIRPPLQNENEDYFNYPLYILYTICTFMVATQLRTSYHPHFQPTWVLVHTLFYHNQYSGAKAFEKLLKNETIK